MKYDRHKPILFHKDINQWIELKGSPYAWQYFPDDFNEFRTFLSESELTNEKTKKWNSDYLELMEHRKNPNYGRTKCFHCLLDASGDDPIFTGINRLVAKGLEIIIKADRQRHDNQRNNMFLNFFGDNIFKISGIFPIPDISAQILYWIVATSKILI